MKTYEKAQIDELRNQGFSFSEISKLTGIGVSALKMRYHRLKASGPDGQCLLCGADLHFIPHKKKKRFCSDACRISWWNSHKDPLKHRLGKEQVCPYCRKTFIVLGNKKRTYCSRDCYASARSKEAKHEL